MEKAPLSPFLKMGSPGLSDSLAAPYTRTVCGSKALTPSEFTVAKLQHDKQWVQTTLEVEPLPGHLPTFSFCTTEDFNYQLCPDISLTGGLDHSQSNRSVTLPALGQLHPGCPTVPHIQHNPNRTEHLYQICDPIIPHAEHLPLPLY